MSTTSDKPAKAPTAAQKRRIEKAKATLAAPIADAPPADTQTPLAKSSAASADKAAKAVQAALAEVPAEDQPKRIEEHPAVASFKGGQSIAAIARSLKIGQGKVREALDAAGVDYSADPNAKAPGAATAKAAKTPAAPKGERTLLASFNAILGKTVDPKSKRGKVVADLASDANIADLKTIVQGLATADAKSLAAGANALNAALSAHYARLS